MKSHTYWASALLVLALALWCTLGVSAEDTTTTASGTAGSFQLEQVYVNAPELDVYFYATDANGVSYSPIVVQAQGVEATLGDRKLDTGLIGVATLVLSLPPLQIAARLTKPDRSLSDV